MAHSNEYVEELKILHNKKTFGVTKGIPLVVNKLIEEKNIKSFLDFGAGKGGTSEYIRNQYPNVLLHTFDPATFPNPLPEEVELTYSSDVLEHVEEHLLDETLQDLCKRSTRYQYHLIACHPAKKRLSDGRNAHLIIEDPQWWKDKIQQIPGWKIIHENIKGPKPFVRGNVTIDVVKYTVILEKV